MRMLHIAIWLSMDSYPVIAFKGIQMHSFFFLSDKHPPLSQGRKQTWWRNAAKMHNWGLAKQLFIEQFIFDDILIIHTIDCLKSVSKACS